MPIALSWSEIAIRLFCAAAASALMGINRSERGRPAGRLADFRYRLLPVFSDLLPADAEMSRHIENVRAPYAAKLAEPLAVSEGLLYRRGIVSGWRRVRQPADRRVVRSTAAHGQSGHTSEEQRPHYASVRRRCKPPMCRPASIAAMPVRVGLRCGLYT